MLQTIGAIENDSLETSSKILSLKKKKAALDSFKT